MHNKERAHRRYILVTRVGLEIIIPQFGEIRLVDFSQGGCGFFAEKQFLIFDNAPIECRLQWPMIVSGSVVVTGRLRHCNHVKFSPDPSLKYYGIEFDIADYEKILPFIEAMQKLEDLSIDMDGKKFVVSLEL